MKINIVPFDPKKHKDQVLAIFKFRPDIFPEMEMIQIIEDLKSEGTNIHNKLVAVTESKVVGYIGTYFDQPQKTWLLDWFSIHPEYKRQGIGKELLTNVIMWLKAKNVTSLLVETCSCEGEADARAFYANRQFKQVKCEVDDYAPGHSKITLQKSFTS
jgi:GNAT superfamily N-acetyltransferase